MHIEHFAIGPLQTNSYVLSHEGLAVAIDPGGKPTPIIKHIEQNGLTLTHILNTHLHFDHIYGNRELSDHFSVPIFASEADRQLMDTEIGRGGLMGLPVADEFDFQAIAEGDAEFAGLPCKVLSTPGHSLGSLTFYFPDAKAAFVGDVVFYRSIGRTDFPGGDMEVLLDSVRKKIFTLPADTALYSGHGPLTTVGDEENHNPFFTSGGF